MIDGSTAEQLFTVATGSYHSWPITDLVYNLAALELWGAVERIQVLPLDKPLLMSTGMEEHPPNGTHAAVGVWFVLGHEYHDCRKLVTTREVDKHQ